MTTREAINYLEPIAQYATLPSYKAALELALKALREKEAGDGENKNAR